MFGAIMMGGRAPTGIGAGTANAGSNSNINNFVITLPTLEVGSLAVVVCTFQNTTGTVTATAGWTQRQNANNGTGMRLVVFDRIIDGTEGSTITINCPTACTGYCYLFEVTNPGTRNYSTPSTSSTSNITFSGPTLSSADRFWFKVCGSRDTAGGNITAPSGYTTLKNFNANQVVHFTGYERKVGTTITAGDAIHSVANSNVSGVFTIDVI